MYLIVSWLRPISMVVFSRRHFFTSKNYKYECIKKNRTYMISVGNMDHLFIGQTKMSIII